MADESKIKKCFVICPIGEAGSEVRAWSDDVLFGLIKPAAEDAGYHANRQIEENRPGEITGAIIRNIDEADLIIADLTWHNPNVFYELALAHAWSKPFILLKGDDLRVPFDISALNTIQVAKSYYRAMDTTRAQLAEHLKAAREGSANFENPVTRHVSRKHIEAEGSPADKKLAAQEDELLTLRIELDDLRAAVKDHATLIYGGRRLEPPVAPPPMASGPSGPSGPSGNNRRGPTGPTGSGGLVIPPRYTPPPQPGGKK